MLNFRSHCIRIGCVGFISAALLANVAKAQTTTWTAPASGYVQDSFSRSVRPVVGFVGSAILGAAVLEDVDWVSLAPNQKSAMVQRGGSLVWIPDLVVPSQMQVIGKVPLARQAFWAADSGRAVILTNDGQLIWLTNFSASAVVAPVEEVDWHLQGLAPDSARGAVGRWLILAVDPSADRVLLTPTNTTGTDLWMASRTVPPSPLPFAGHPTAAVFATNTATAFVADNANHQIVRIQGLDVTPVQDTLLSSEVYVDEPSGLALSVDGGQLIVADRKSATIRVFDLLIGTLISELIADAIPHSLTPLTPSRFMLNSGGISAQPLLFLDTTAPARVSFIPRGN